MYTIYHIPGKKIGVTRNINKRVTEQQGYAPDEYEVLLTSDDIDYISTMEIELQKSYGYKVDRQTYKNLINKIKSMNINATEQTSTFPCPLNKLKGQLMDNLDLSWETSHGTFKITKKNIPWILSNARTSMFNSGRCYIYNKALSSITYLSTTKVVLDKKKKKSKKVKPNKPFYAENEENVYDLIRSWAKDKGIYLKGDSKTQYLKLMEEAGELAEALLKNDRPEIIDAIGDMVVVLTNLAALEKLKLEDCVTSAYDVIKSRQGEMVNGTFVKSSSTVIDSGPTTSYSSNGIFHPKAYKTTNTL
jgi:NTP pyrophosphatase (non-canonical NTP hydrolase)